MSTAYHSFLICDHPKEGFVNVYIDGLIIGQIIQATQKFVPDPLMERRNPFGSLEALHDHVVSIMRRIAGDPTRFQPPTPGPSWGGLPAAPVEKLDDKISAMVDAFLAWPLPSSVCPDRCVLDREYPHRIGTNLLTAVEARQMFEYAIAKASAKVKSDVVGKPFLTFGTDMASDAVVKETEDDYQGGDGFRRISVTASPPNHLSLKMQINLNGSEVDVYPKNGEFVLSYEEIVRMAVSQLRTERDILASNTVDPLPHLTVVYHHKVPFEQLPGEREGSLWHGCKPVKVTQGMIINAMHTGNG